MKKFIFGIFLGVLIAFVAVVAFKEVEHQKQEIADNNKAEAINKFRRNKIQANKAQNKMAEEINQMVANLVQAKNPQDMLQAVDEMIKLRPQDANLYLLKSQILKKQGNLKAALNEINKAISLDPKNPNLYQFKAEIEFASKDFTGAERDFTAAAKLSGKADNYYNRAITNLNLGDYAAANKDFKTAQALYDKEGNKAASKQSQNVSNLLTKNMALTQPKSQQKANKQSKQNIQNTPQNNDAINKMITNKMANSLKQFSESDTLKGFREMFPQANFLPKEDFFNQQAASAETPETMHTSGDVIPTKDIHLPNITEKDVIKGSALESMQKAGELMAKKDYKGAQAVLDEAIKNIPNDDNLYYNRANTNYKQGNYKDAFKDLDKALEINPKNYNAAIMKGDLFNGMGQSDKAKEAYQEAAQLAKENGDRKAANEATAKYQLIEGKEITAKTNERLTEAANAYYKQDFDRAVSLFNQIYNENPTPENAFNLGLAYRGQGKKEEAHQMFTVAADNKPQDFNSQILAAQSAMELENPDLRTAKKYLDRAKNIDDTNPDMWALSAQINSINGDNDSVKEDLRNALLGYTAKAEETNDPQEKAKIEAQIAEIKDYLQQLNASN